MIYIIAVLAVLLILAVRKNYKLITQCEELQDELSVSEDAYIEVLEENDDLEFMVLRMQNQLLALEEKKSNKKKPVKKVAKKKSK